MELGCLVGDGVLDASELGAGVEAACRGDGEADGGEGILRGVTGTWDYLPERVFSRRRIGAGPLRTPSERKVPAYLPRPGRMLSHVETAAVLFSGQPDIRISQKVFAGGRLDETGQASQQGLRLVNIVLLRDASVKRAPKARLIRTPRRRCPHHPCTERPGLRPRRSPGSLAALNAARPLPTGPRRRVCLPGRVNPQPTTLPGKEQKTWGDYGLVRMMAQVPDGRAGVKHGHGSADTEDSPCTA